MSLVVSQAPRTAIKRRRFPLLPSAVFFWVLLGTVLIICRNPTHKRKRKAERPTVQRQRLGATAGWALPLPPAPGRPSCIGGAPCVRNAGVVRARGFLRDEFGVLLFDLFTY